MKDISLLEQKIALLKRKKEQLHLKAAHDLYKQLGNLLGPHFNPELVLGMVYDQVNSSTPQQQKKWQELGATFFRTNLREKANKTAAFDQSAESSTATESTPNEA